MGVGTLVYSIWLKKTETRTLVIISLVVMFISEFFNMALTLQWYEAMGMSAFTFIFFTSSTLFPLVLCLYMIPPFVLIAKITPSHVEATIFAFSASVIGVCIWFLPKLMGLVWNKLLFDVGTENLDQLYKCYIVDMCGVLVTLLYVGLIPTWEEVAAVQEKVADFNLEAKTPLTLEREDS